MKTKQNEDADYVVALAGNPNVGKSTVFNALTGMHQHTGNWPGKTVSNAFGNYIFEGESYTVVDLPGMYSLSAHSKEEAFAEDFLFSLESDAVAVVCDATCLLRNLHLVLQIAELVPHTVVCLNLMDEAKKKGIKLDVSKLSKLLGLPIIPMVARSELGIDVLKETLKKQKKEQKETGYAVPYPQIIEDAVRNLEAALSKSIEPILPLRALSLLLLKNKERTDAVFHSKTGIHVLEQPAVQKVLAQIDKDWKEKGYTKEHLQEDCSQAIVKEAEKLFTPILKQKAKANDFTKKADRIFMNKALGIPVMLLLLLLVFWITIVGANYPSKIISDALFSLETPLLHLFTYLHFPAKLSNMLVFGLWRSLSWVVGVMLPPMAIFFPLFTLLEDFGYLPRVAFNLDHPFRKSGTCGKQALTMCMGFGCNAVGVTGARIIDSKRESLIAILTNNLVPCNGRFPILISVLTMFFVGMGTGFKNSLLQSVLLTLTILFSVMVTLWVSKFLSKTFLRGIPSSFTLELPPYRKPQIGKVIVRSIFDRTLFVLGRAVVVAAPAGILLWILANVSLGGTTLLEHCAVFLDPFAKWLGLDGVILLAFILGMPANEIVFPIILMAYLNQGALLEMDVLSQLHTLLLSHGWSIETAICVLLFTLMHWPCSTTLITIYKETKSLKWTSLAFLLPTILGFLSCFLVHLLFLGIGQILPL